MSKGSYLIGFLLLLAGCDGGYETDVCDAATQGLNRQPDEAAQCRQDAWQARYHAVHKTAQKYRDMPR